MYCTVYRLYDGQGNRLQNDVAKVNGQPGWLVYRLRRPITGEPLCHALLLPKEGAPDQSAVLPPLNHAHLRMLHGGRRLTGQDLDAHHPYLKQAWLVVPGVEISCWRGFWAFRSWTANRTPRRQRSIR